ncbi:hypothetical protein BDA99DRAFT_568322 [Phascolomyces articulosus]|uniref:Uncharacterized protein n=1 Tax=Phascolomyces articulosus TaxID=60185 RepID=A0AAD5K9I5_9FUNG|nr:hypothetical protein BDA99DRAFT_568322 [Phascolomyces articulosus]
MDFNFLRITRRIIEDVNGFVANVADAILIHPQEPDISHSPELQFPHLDINIIPAVNDDDDDDEDGDADDNDKEDNDDEEQRWWGKRLRDPQTYFIVLYLVVLTSISTTIIKNSKRIPVFLI